jgi:pilus assembly protein CpaE
VLNRLEKGFFRNLGAADAERVLRKPISFSVANDHATMSQAIDRGVPLAEIKRKCPLVKDIETMEQGVAAALGLEH